MTLSPQFLDEIRNRVAAHEVIGRKVRLARAGREWRGLCPFHGEKSPSFYVNDEKGFYHCFGCGAHGDVIRFLTESEGRGFREAVEELAEMAGLDMPAENRADPQAAARLSGLRDCLAAAQAWFAEQLMGMGGARARDYLAGRGLSQQTMRDFGLGYAPDQRQALKAALQARGASLDMLIEAGLLVAVDGREPYDRFRGRVMFAIRDPRGRVIGFGGRLLEAGEPKYLNSPETPLFEKGRILFNFDRAGPAARKTGAMLVVEGYMDVIALAQAGIHNAVAPLGTALTEDQLRLLWRVADEPTLCFDGDAAGQRAAVRAALRALPLLAPGKSLRFVDLPAGRDPDDVVRDGGAAAIAALTGKASPLVDRLWEAEARAFDLSTPERRAAFRQSLLNHVDGIGDPDVRQLYRAEMRRRLDALVRPQADSRRSASCAPFGPSPELRSGDAGRAIMLALLAALIEHPSWGARHLELLANVQFDQTDIDQLWQAALSASAALEAEPLAPVGRSHGESEPERSESSPHPVDMLDKERMRHNLQQLGFGPLIAEVMQRQRLSFSFTRADSADAVAEQEFVAAVANHLRFMAAVQTLAEATAQCETDMDEAALVRQQLAVAEWRSAEAAWRQLGQMQGAFSPGPANGQAGA